VGEKEGNLMKKTGLIFGGAMIVLFVLFGVVFGNKPSEKAGIITRQPAANNPEFLATSKLVANTIELSSKIKQEAILKSKQVDLETYLVSRVIDGDTIEIEGGQKVRYIGIDTPETVDPRKPVQCFGAEAKKRNEELVKGKYVRLEKDVSDKDKYGRLVRYVYTGGVFVNLVLVEEGFAFSYTYPPDVKYQNQFLKAERQAHEQNNGLWGACPTFLSTLIPVSTPIQTFPPVSTTGTTCTIKGNITTEKIYHLQGCESYDKTKIDEARGERWFCTEAEAVAAGWRKAQNCQ
jgi:micrococcal nuclease